MTMHSRPGRVCKRVFDFVASALALALFSPALLWIALAIRRESPGPAIFSQQRAGQRGKPFTFHKFRTMRTDADPYGRSPTSGEDPRLTRVGRWLRERSLDELPQLYNVLRGDMSLVGPRPLYLQQAERWNDRQRRRLEVRPGLTGLAQVRDRAEMTHEEKIEIDVQYVERASLWLDLRLLLATVGLVGRRESIYETKAYHDEERAWDASSDRSNPHQTS
jgi:lipopolysaccharide/colanic/teichoic acid biosynthesis glycosyltransferase